MMSGSKDSGIGQSKRIGWGGDFLRRDQDTPDTNGTGTQQPDRPAVPPDCGRDGHPGHAQGASHGVRRHTIRNNGRKPVANRLDVERAQLHELVKRVVRRTRDVDAIGHRAA